MPKIVNKRYKEFIDTGVIQTISQEDMLQTYLPKITGKHAKEGRAMVISNYLTGNRPAENLLLKAENLRKDGNTLYFHLQTLKNGLPRMFPVKLKNPLAKELYEYVKTLHPQMFLFPHYRSKDFIKTVKIKRKDGTIEVKQYKVLSNNLTYYYKKWFGSDVIPYFFRHNRFSKLAMKGKKTATLRLLKGAKGDASVTPYIHLSTDEIKNVAKDVD